MNPKLTAERLRRRALVYIRQSTPGQLQHNQESQRRQYGLADRAREFGFNDVAVVDDDLGRSGSGLVERPGFQRLVAEVCSGQVGAVFCIEASRLARNGRDWHHLIELCGMVGAVVVDPDGIYDPGVINDRLLLGLKGTMSEFELSLLRQRSQEAIRQKAARGELRFDLPVGFCWGLTGKIETDSDQRVQHTVRLVFDKMAELASMRQVLLWFHNENCELPAAIHDASGTRVVWKAPVYHSILAMVTNPMYAGAYAFGKTESRTKMIEDRARKSSGHRKPIDQWTVLIRDHHPGYITWEQYERNQAIIAQNAHMRSTGEPKSGRGGRALLSGLLRCGRCGRLLHVWYREPGIARFHCWGTSLYHGGKRCIAFGASAPAKAISQEILRAVGDNAVEAAIQAAEQGLQQQQAKRQAFELELEEVRYQAHIASRRFEAVDPANRLVAAELETRWNAALKRVSDIEQKLRSFDSNLSTTPPPDRQLLTDLARRLSNVWESERTDMRIKQRVVRILIREIVVDVDDVKREILMTIHWIGGRHSELRVPKPGPGDHRRRTNLEAVEVVRQMSGQYPDKEIASTLNRLALKTGAGNTWTPLRVATLRSYHRFPAFQASNENSSFLTLEQAADKLGVCATTARKLIDLKILRGTQVVESAPWRIPKDAIEDDAVRQAVKGIKDQRRVPQLLENGNQGLMFSDT